ncbi:MAG: hypothetical protein INF81_08665 [Roseomonas sp.]|nr:hypothetical protein [Roseomonas sp.]MCA3429708.1 hypothetical protein [Roseomonas sp.]MCA3433665.1 hypothetical protein [Roseomonas sp.]
MLRYALALCAALFAGNVQAADLPYGGSGPAATVLISLDKSFGRAGKTPHHTNAQKQEMMMTETLAPTTQPKIILAQARQSTPSPQEQLQAMVNRLSNGGDSFISRIDCMNGRMASLRDNNTPGYFDQAPQATVGQFCRGVLEAAAGATARGKTGGVDLLAPFRDLRSVDGMNPTPQTNQAALALVNGLVNVSRNPAYANSTGTPMQLDGQGKVYQASPGAALDATFAQAVSETRAGRPAPNRITSWNDAQINNAVEACVRGRDTLIRCSAVGQEVAAIYLSRPRSERQPR